MEKLPGRAEVRVGKEPATFSFGSGFEDGAVLTVFLSVWTRWACMGVHETSQIRVIPHGP